MIYNHTDKSTCPICGKQGSWCGHGEGLNGPLAYCGRISVPKGTVVAGADGNEWVSVRPDGSMYCGYGLKVNEDAARERYKKQRREEKNNDCSKPYKYREQTEPVQKSVINAKYIDRSGYRNEILNASTDSAKLDRVYRTLLNCLILEPEHRTQLENEWGKDLFKDITSRNPIASLPMDDIERYEFGKFGKSPFRKAVIQEMYNRGITNEDMIGVPGFYQLPNGKIALYRLSGIVFPVYDGKGNIVRIRIKDDFPTAKGTYKGAEGVFFYNKQKNGWHFIADDKSVNEIVYHPKNKIYKVELENKTSGVPLSDGGRKSKIEGKYKNFSSCKEKMDDENKSITNFFKNGCQSGSFPSLYCNSEDNFAVVFFTEGEKKAMVANKLLKCPCVSFPGVGTFKKAFENLTDTGSLITELVRKGMKQAVLVYDADKNSNANVLRAEKNCVLWFRDHGISMAIGEWNADFGKGLDDVLLKGIAPMLYEVR